MSTAKHVMKRVLMMLAGYLVAILVGLIAVVAIYAALSSLPGAPAYFDLMGVSPIAALVVPPLGMFIYFLTVVLTAPQTLIFALIAEFFSLRTALLHMLFGAAAAAESGRARRRTWIRSAGPTSASSPPPVWWPGWSIG